MSCVVFAMEQVFNVPSVDFFDSQQAVDDLMNIEIPGCL